MAQHDYVIANQGFPSFRSDLNNALSAVISNNSGTSAPTTTAAGFNVAFTNSGGSGVSRTFDFIAKGY